MSWLYLPGQAGNCSPVSGCSDGEPCATLNGKRMRSRSSRRAFEMGGSTTRRSGTTRSRSTGDPGVDAWILSLRGSRASRSASQAKASRKPTRATDGLPSSASFGRYDRALRCWRMCQVSLPNHTPELFSGSWPKRGSMRNGIASRRKRLARTIGGNGFGCLPTPLAGRSTWQNSHGRKVHTLRGMALHNKWPTPAAMGWGNEGSRKMLDRLMDTGKISAEENRRIRIGNKWPTPTTPRPHDNEKTAGKYMPSQKQKDLTWAVEHYPTLTARDYRSPNRNGNFKDQLPNAVGGQLNPDWVEWLMGWPIGWSALEPLGTDRFQEWLRKHGRG